MKTFTVSQVQQFKDFVYNDVEKSIQAKTNFLTALGLLCYTEFFGAIINDTVGKAYNSRKNFETGLYAMGKGYEVFDKQLKEVLKGNGVYRVFRCGMVHNYFIDHSLSVIARDNKGGAPGLGQNKAGAICIATANYFSDFKVALDSFYSDLIKNHS